MKQQSPGRQYNSIDLFKFLFAFAVIDIHTKPLVNCSIKWLISLNEVIICMAVPFFFISTGFLFGNRLLFSDDFNQLESSRNLSQNSELLKDYLIRIIKMYLLWMLIYSPLAVAYYINSGYSLFKSAASFLIGLIFVGEQYNSYVLWYLLSTIYAISLILFLNSRGG